MSDITEKLKILASTDIFKSGREPATFVGRPFYFDYETVKVLVNDKDAAIRSNRLHLLAALRNTMHLVADFSKIGG